MTTSWPPYYFGTVSTAWDYGLRWYLEEATEPDWDLDPLTLAFVRDQHLRSPNGGAEDSYITSLIRTSYRMAERQTARALIPTSRVLVADGFPPGGPFIVPRPPLLSVTSLAWLDASGYTQDVEAADLLVETPSGPRARYGRVTPVSGGSWPSAIAQMGAMRLTFVAGYVVADGENGKATIPEDINAGRLLIIGELYKQRSESVHAFNQSPALIRARDMFAAYRAY